MFIKILIKLVKIFNVKDINVFKNICIDLKLK